MDVELILRAAAYAAEAHALQKRKASPVPYINHPLRVAHRAVQAGLPAEAVAASLLHDVVEDTSLGLEDVGTQFPDRVVHLVRLLSKWWPDDAPQELKRTEKPKYYGAIEQDQDAMAIKLLDRADNMEDMVRMLPKARRWAEKYLSKTEREIRPIYEASTNTVARTYYDRAMADLRRALETKE